MAPSVLIVSTSQTGHPSASGRTIVNAAATNSLNPLAASFGGPVVTATHEDTSAGPLLLDPTGSTATKHLSASATVTSSIPPLISFAPSSEAAPASSQSATGKGHPTISQATLIGVTVAISVIAFTALCLMYYLYWRKRRPTATATSETPVPVKEKERRRVTWTLRGVISERDARDPFADVHQPLPARPPLPADTPRGSAKTVPCATDAGSVYVLDGESIYGDNGASVKGVLPPAYDDLPRKTLLRELPPLPERDGRSIPEQITRS